MIKDDLLKEEKRLSELLELLEKRSGSRLEGHLHAFYSHNTNQYAIVFSKGQKQQYLPKSMHKLASQYAQQEYEDRLIKVVRNELNLIKLASEYYSSMPEDRVYEQLPKARKDIVKPIRPADCEFTEQWQSVSYQGNCFYDDSAQIITERGEAVKSKSEKIIADKLYSMGVPYRYEYPLALKGLGTVYPDFNVLNVKNRREYYWEHFGMMDDANYCAKVLKKLQSYSVTGILPGKELIVTFESSRNPIDTRTLTNIIEYYCLS